MKRSRVLAGPPLEGVLLQDNNQQPYGGSGGSVAKVIKRL